MVFFRFLLKILLLVTVFTAIGLGVMFYSDLKRLGEGYYAYYRGNTAYQEQHYEQALTFFLQAQEGFPDSIKLYLKIGDTYLRLNEHENAIVYFKKAVDADPSNSLALAKLAKTEWLMGHEQVAMGLYYDAIQTYPNNPAIRADMGDLYLTRAKTSKDPKDYEKAIHALEKAMEKEESQASIFARYKLAESYYAQGQYEESLEIYCELATLYPNNPETLYSLGVAYSKNNAYDEAALYIGRAAEAINIQRPELSEKWAQRALQFKQVAAHKFRPPSQVVQNCNTKLAEVEEKEEETKEE